MTNTRALPRSHLKILEIAETLGRPFHAHEAARRFGPRCWIWLPRLERDGYLISTGKNIYTLGRTL